MARVRHHRGDRRLAALCGALVLLCLAPAGAELTFALDWAREWRNTHYPGGAGNADTYGLAVDAAQNLYLCGSTWESAGDPCTGFLVKLSPDFTELWYRADYMPATSEYTGLHRVVLAPDGNLVTQATVMLDGDSYARVMKINPQDGSVVWQTDLARGNHWAEIWDGAAGPAVDSQGNIFIATGLGQSKYSLNGEPLGLWKLSPDGEVLWSAQDRLVDSLPDAVGWDDIWEVAVDAQGAVYVCAASLGPPSRGFSYGLVKYTADGERAWVRECDWGNVWDMPRGLAIDTVNGRLYQDGNASAGPELAGAVVYDLEGNQLTWNLLDQKCGYPYGTLVDANGNLFVPGLYGPECISEFSLYSPDLARLAVVEYRFPGCNSYNVPGRATQDTEGGLYALQLYSNSDWGGRMVAGVTRIETAGPVPEPSSLLAFLGALPLLWQRRRRR